MQSTLLCVLCLLVAAATAQMLGDRGELFPGGNRTQCRSPDSIAADGCNVDCIQRNRTSDIGCPYCNRTCNERMMMAQCPQIRCSTPCPNGYQRAQNGCQTCNCRSADELPCNVTVQYIVERRRCDRTCVMRNDENCPMCDRECNRTAPMMMDQDRCREDDDCRGRAICLSRGDTGIQRCMNLTDVGGMCEAGEEERERDTHGGDFDGTDDEEETRALGLASRVSGARDRTVIGVGVLSSVDTEECREGLRCSDGGRCEMVMGPCITERRSNSDSRAECDDDGNFRPTQCRSMDGSRMLRCYCVHLNGTRLDSRNVTVSNREDAPDCETRVLRPCRSMLSGRNYTVQHGDYFLRPYSAERCQRCLCQNGWPGRCANITQGNCSVVRPPTDGRLRNCSARGMMIPHGNRSMVGRCNMCFCRDGRLVCTRLRSCENGTENNDTCRMCRRMPRNPVCGRDGRTYHSMCFAMHCAGLQPNRTLPGACPSLPTCNLYPCPRGFVCLRSGGALCLNRDGCRDSERRLCVNRTRLNCRNRDVDESVCGSNGLSYNSSCHMLQDTSNVQVAHARRCDDQECSGGQVCGTDRVTYNNVCEMRSQSGNARMDHMGRCDEGTNQTETIDDMCERVRRSGMCPHTRENCSHRVQPEEGCCPVCGAVVNVAVDRDGLGDYTDLNPSVDTVDEFMEKLVRNNVVPRNVSDRCEIQASTTASRNIEIALSARNRTHAQYCHQQGQELANRINRNMTRSMGNEDESATIELPPELEFAAAATSAPLIVDDITPTPGGAPHLVPSLLLLLAAILLTTLF